MRDEFIPFLFSQQFLEVVEECKTFLVGDAGEGVVGVFIFQIDYESCKVMAGAEVVDRVRQGFPADDCGEVAMGFTVAVYC